MHPRGQKWSLGRQQAPRCWSAALSDVAVARSDSGATSFGGTSMGGTRNTRTWLGLVRGHWTLPILLATPMPFDIANGRCAHQTPPLLPTTPTFVRCRRPATCYWLSSRVVSCGICYWRSSAREATHDLRLAVVDAYALMALRHLSFVTTARLAPGSPLSCFS